MAPLDITNPVRSRLGAVIYRVFRVTHSPPIHRSTTRGEAAMVVFLGNCHCNSDVNYSATEHALLDSTRSRRSHHSDCPGMFVPSRISSTNYDFILRIVDNHAPSESHRGYFCSWCVMGLYYFYDVFHTMLRLSTHGAWMTLKDKKI